MCRCTFEPGVVIPLTLLCLWSPHLFWTLRFQRRLVLGTPDVLLVLCPPPPVCGACHIFLSRNGFSRFFPSSTLNSTSALTAILFYFCFSVCSSVQTKAFLTGTLQNFARRMKFAIDTVQFNFLIVETPWEELTERPQVHTPLCSKLVPHGVFCLCAFFADPSLAILKLFFF